MTTRRYASGEIDWTGRISKCGDKMLRSYLYEAANVLEPISKSPEEDYEASESHEAKEVLGVEFPTDENATLPLDPGEESLHEPAPHITA